MTDFDYIGTGGFLIKCKDEEILGVTKEQADHICRVCPFFDCCLNGDMIESTTRMITKVDWRLAIARHIVQLLVTSRTRLSSLEFYEEFMIHADALVINARLCNFVNYMETTKDHREEEAEENNNHTTTTKFLELNKESNFRFWLDATITGEQWSQLLASDVLLNRKRTDYVVQIHHDNHDDAAGTTTGREPSVSSTTTRTTTTLIPPETITARKRTLDTRKRWYSVHATFPISAIITIQQILGRSPTSDNDDNGDNDDDGESRSGTTSSDEDDEDDNDVDDASSSTEGGEGSLSSSPLLPRPSTTTPQPPPHDGRYTLHMKTKTSFTEPYRLMIDDMACEHEILEDKVEEEEDEEEEEGGEGGGRKIRTRYMYSLQASPDILRQMIEPIPDDVMMSTVLLLDDPSPDTMGRLINATQQEEVTKKCRSKIYFDVDLNRFACHKPKCDILRILEYLADFSTTATIQNLGKGICFYEKNIGDVNYFGVVCVSLLYGTITLLS